MIKKEQFDYLFDENITKKQYNKIINDIDKRFGEICEIFLIKTNKNAAWYSYRNSLGYNEIYYFDPDEYRDYIKIDGEYIKPPDGYGYEFPTRWLWEDFEDELKSNIEQYRIKEKIKKDKKKQQVAARKQQVDILKSSIKTKLTPEELKIVKFK